MTRIVEVKEFIKDSDLYYNLYAVTKLLREIETDIQFAMEINKDDYNYINTIIYKMKVNLKKVSTVLKIQGGV